MSPFVSLPTAVTLPYTYKSMPSTLPPPVTGVTGTAAAAEEKPRYVVAPSTGHAAHPDEIIASCRALRDHLTRMKDDMEAVLRRFDDRIRDRELAEKRRVAPGWLDSDARLLEPERRPAAVEAHAEAEAGVPGAGVAGHYEIAGRLAEMSITSERQGPSEMAVDQGAELDRAFGGMK